MAQFEFLYAIFRGEDYIACRCLSGDSLAHAYII